MKPPLPANPSSMQAVFSFPATRSPVTLPVISRTCAATAFTTPIFPSARSLAFGRDEAATPGRILQFHQHAAIQSSRKHRFGEHRLWPGYQHAGYAPAHADWLALRVLGRPGMATRAKHALFSAAASVFFLASAAGAQDAQQDWTHFVRIGAYGLSPANADSIVANASRTH